jgi:Tetracyclin repressor-like, C-terminal domain
LYRQGFSELRATGAGIDPALTGADRVVANALAYRRSALERPELYSVMFERPFRSYKPSSDSRAVALAAFEPLVDAVASTGRDPGEARGLALTLWASMHGLVHLELQGYFSFEPSSEQRTVDVVRAVLAHAN